MVSAARRGASTSQIISAIEVGAPAYNAGDIELCVETYEHTARRLLEGTLRSELAPGVADALEEALLKASALRTRSSERGSETDRLSWAFRRAFDAQLQDQAPQKARGNVRGSLGTSTDEVIARAISVGAPAYNRGDIAGCERVYLDTARQLLDQGSLDAGQRRMLEQKLKECQQMRDVNGRARVAAQAALDALRGGPRPAAGGGERLSTGQGVAGVAISGGAAGVLCDFVSGEGLKVTKTVVNDTVMGGRSESQASVGSSADGVLFEGYVTRQGGGGFASVRFEATNVAAMRELIRNGAAIVLRVRRLRGCKAWKVQLNASPGFFDFVGTQWQADFEAPDVAGLIRVPFSNFMPTRYGKPMGARGLTGEAIDGITGLSDGGSESRSFQEGPFGLSILSIAVE
eukprot:CAMPEP_0117607722 /NCGR_PEP_ID=MMETSP0784-20121206/80430_1 /TAXON_ID=39447 /ORGANISM="" /LENGTH=402 /DNA_ID=CAMNT_0005410955 /DNA_START=89 /DNA_END=1298 /DNA_ORIENTATION=+